jgi:hypothetical protein
MVSQTALRDRQVHELIQVRPRVWDELLKLAVLDEKGCRHHDTDAWAAKSTQFDLAGPACYECGRLLLLYCLPQCLTGGRVASSSSTGLV